MVLISCDIKDGHLVHLKVDGHAGNDENGRIACAAISCLTRTICDMTERLIGVTSVCSAPEPGNVVLDINNIDNCLYEMFSGVTDFFIYGIIGVKMDYSNAVQIKINNKEWYNGSQERWW